MPRYNIPSQGTTNWHQPLNDNFKRLDVDVEIRDVEANLSEYEPKDGAKFLALDTYTTYYGDGQEWHIGREEPWVYSANYDSYQAAMDEAGNGTVIINDTKEEEGIKFKDIHDNIELRWIGDNWIHQPENYTPGTPILSGSGSRSELSENIRVTLTNPRIKNPYLRNEDIENEDSYDANSDRSSAIEWANPNDWTDIHPRKITINGGIIRNVNGYGVHIHRLDGTAIINKTDILYTALDSFYFKGRRDSEHDARVFVSDYHSKYSGRHGACIMEDITYAQVSGLIEHPYTSGIYIEEEGWSSPEGIHVHCPGLHIRGAVRRTSSSHRRAIENSNGRLSGHIRTTNCRNNQNFCNRLEGSLENLTLVVDRDDGATHNNNNVPAVRVIPDEGASSASIIVKNEGSADSTGAVRILNNPNIGLKLDIHCENVPGLATRIERCIGSEINIVSKNPCQVGREAHVYLTGINRERSTGNTITLTAYDDTGSANYGIKSGGNEGNNLILGNVTEGYSISATDRLNTSNNTELLMD